MQLSSSLLCSYRATFDLLAECNTFRSQFVIRFTTICYCSTLPTTRVNVLHLPDQGKKIKKESDIGVCSAEDSIYIRFHFQCLVSQAAYVLVHKCKT